MTVGKWASLMAQMVKNLPAMQETQVQSLVLDDPWRREWQPTLFQYSGLENPMEVNGLLQLESSGSTISSGQRPRGLLNVLQTARHLPNGIIWPQTLA